MAAPTPVSALVHSSTLVTAGVYLLIRFRPVLSGTKVQTVLLLLACLTIFIAGLGANFETDLKKIIALSTLSQLGVIMSVLAMGYPELAFFHLLAHALFKALLFICAGAIIHRVGDYQDIRVIGGLVRFMPLRVIRVNLANLALCGFPFLAGFYSKDLILEVAFLSPLNEACFWLLVGATGLTVCYTFRLIFYSLRGDYNLGLTTCVRDEDSRISWPIIGLGVGAVVGGAALSWLIFPAPHIICLRLEFKLLALIVRVLGGLIGYILNMMIVNYLLNSLRNYNLVVFSGSMWFIPFLSTNGAGPSLLNIGAVEHQVGDGGWYEYYGGAGIWWFFSKLSIVLYYLESHNIKGHITFFLI